jgi:hypothetical protein
MSSRFPRVDLSKVRRVSIEERGGAVTVDEFVEPRDPGPAFDAVLDLVPDLFAGRDFRAAVAALGAAARAGKVIAVMFGAHVIKCGLSRLIIDLMERGVVSALATNGAGAIHDYEIAMWGATSEDVRAGLEDGTFGMCAETADGMNAAAVWGRSEGAGLGESLGRALVESGAPNRTASILARAHELGIPVTVHVALGTDIVHEHASADGAAIGETSMADFRIFAATVGRLDGGAIVNIGSAVILPEVFLKALAVARNLGLARSFTAVSMDMGEPYRAMVNVVDRPTEGSGLGIALRGRHELLLPLLWAALVRDLSGP